jgi:hypothetical protein
MEGFTLVQPPLQIFRAANQEVHRKRHLNFPPNLRRLVMLIPRRHDHQDIHIAVGVRCAVCMRAEQDDHFRLEPLGDLASKPANLGHGNTHSATAPRRRRGNHGCSAFFTHAIILPRSRPPPKADRAGALIPKVGLELTPLTGTDFDSGRSTRSVVSERR